MTRVEFFADGGHLNGFSVSGHSSLNCRDEEGKIVCSAVSSAVYMTANTLTDIIGEKCDIYVDDAVFTLRTDSRDASTQAVLKGLKLHLTELSVQYPKRIKIITEV